jgi:hypothetical protein
MALALQSVVLLPQLFLVMVQFPLVQCLIILQQGDIHMHITIYHAIAHVTVSI